MSAFQSTSEKLRRRLLSVDSQDVQAVDCLFRSCLLLRFRTHRLYPDDDVSPDACISAIAISVNSETQLDDAASLLSDAASFIGSHVGLISDGDPFADTYEANDCRINIIYLIAFELTHFNSEI
jgi:hypothetical protein